MSDLHFTGRARAAATAILDVTTLGRELDGHYEDDGRLLTVAANADDWMHLSSGERVLLGVLEAIAGHRSTVTWLDIASRLDRDSQVTVIAALGLLCGIDVRQGVRA